MRPGYFLFAAAAMLVQSSAGAAEDRYECQLRCSSDQDERYANCRATYGTPQLKQKQEKCFKDSQTVSTACLKQCPPSPPSTPYDAQPQPQSKEY